MLRKWSGKLVINDTYLKFISTGLWCWKWRRNRTKKSLQWGFNGMKHRFGFSPWIKQPLSLSLPPRIVSAGNSKHFHMFVSLYFFNSNTPASPSNKIRPPGGSMKKHHTVQFYPYLWLDLILNIYRQMTQCGHSLEVMSQRVEGNICACVIILLASTVSIEEWIINI